MDNQQATQQTTAPITQTAPAAHETTKKGTAIFAVVISITNISVILLLFALSQIVLIAASSSFLKGAQGAIAAFALLCVGLFPITVPVAIIQLVTDIIALICGISFSKKLKQNADDSQKGLKKASIILPIIATILIIAVSSGVLAYLATFASALYR